MIKNSLNIIILFTLISFLGSCKKENTVNSFEQSVFYEIFPDIIDSIYSDSRLRQKPPSPFYIDSEGTKLQLDPIEHEQLIKKWKDRTQEILNDNSPIYITIVDSVSKSDRYDNRELINRYSNLNLTVNSKKNGLNEAYLINLKSLKTNNGKLTFKYRSEFPKGKEFWKKDYGYYLAANIGFSKILFDKTKNYGVLNISYSKGALEGNGFKIFIKKNKNGKWIIDGVIETWIT